MSAGERPQTAIGPLVAGTKPKWRYKRSKSAMVLPGHIHTAVVPSVQAMQLYTRETPPVTTALATLRFGNRDWNR